MLVTILHTFLAQPLIKFHKRMLETMYYVLCRNLENESSMLKADTKLSRTASLQPLI